jgi:heme-degrading monooxygenase HmoA
MYTATFTFAKRQFDAAFHALDAVIADVAKTTPGYLGEESWENPASGLVCTVYYWDSLESLQVLMQHSKHLEAKLRQKEWLDGYQVVIAEVVGCYGDGGISHPLASVGLPLRRGSDR